MPARVDPDPPAPAPAPPSELLLKQEELKMAKFRSYPSLAAACGAMRDDDGSAFGERLTGCTIRKGKEQALFFVEIASVNKLLRHPMVESIVIAPAVRRKGVLFVAIDARVSKPGTQSMLDGDESGTIGVREFRIDLVGDSKPEIVFTLTPMAVNTDPTELMICDDQGAWCTIPITIERGQQAPREDFRPRQPPSKDAFKFERDPGGGVRVIDLIGTRVFQFAN